MASSLMENLENIGAALDEFTSAMEGMGILTPGREESAYEKMCWMEDEAHQIYMEYVKALGTPSEKALGEQYEEICAEIDRLAAEAGVM